MLELDGWMGAFVFYALKIMPLFLAALRVNVMFYFFALSRACMHLLQVFIRIIVLLIM